MEELPHIITDLAMILMVAGVVTIIFKRFKQPLVLGYIVAGFLAGPHMPYTPTVDDMVSVNIWSQIGVIFMMFALGLEFSFKKIVKMGMAPIIAAVCIMVSMIGVGSLVGSLFGWNSMDRLFLGGMLAMSSTTIIYKAFDDLGIRTKKFAGSVMSVLILEDILGILLMVILSALAVSKHFEGGQLALSLFKLGFFLLLWFVVGIYIIPLFLKKNSKFINSETLLICSVGLCFALVQLASSVGYSPAFGAFMMGSILAETVEAERIEKVIGSTKDLFGAIFFVSVGMLVDPAILLQYWLPILAITLAILLGQCLFGTLSYILSGQNLKSAMQSGFSMAQIGEFAFIIAALGESKGVTSGFLYPVVVAVSIVTTFLTPYMIKAAAPAYKIFVGLAPNRLKEKIGERKSNNAHSKVKSEENVQKKAWKKVTKDLVMQVAVYLTVSVAVIAISTSLLNHLLVSLCGESVGGAICALVTVVLVSPFLRAIVMRKNHSNAFRTLALSGHNNRWVLVGTIILRFALAVFIVFQVLSSQTTFWWLIRLVAAVFAVVLLCYSRVVKYASIRIERTFRQNLSRRDYLSSEHGASANMARRLQSRDLHLTRLLLPDNSAWGGCTLKDLQFGRKDNVLVAAIVRGNLRINIPSGDVKLFPRDIIEVVGDDAGIELLSARMAAEVEANADDAEQMHIKRMLITQESPYIGLSLLNSGIRSDLHCMVIGFEEEDGSLSIPSADRVFSRGDVVWLVG